MREPGLGENAGEHKSVAASCDVGKRACRCQARARIRRAWYFVLRTPFPSYRCIRGRCWHRANPYWPREPKKEREHREPCRTNRQGRATDAREPRNRDRPPLERMRDEG